MKTIRVLLVDDHALVRAGFRMLLQQMAGVHIVGEGSDSRTVLQLIKTSRPDVVIMDLTVPGLTELEATRQVTRVFPKVRVLILSVYTAEDYVIQALRAGAAGYLLKDARPTELEIAVQAVARGDTYLSAAVSKTVVTDYLYRLGGKDGGGDGAINPAALLTPRQREILQLIAEGRTTKEIAVTLQITENTAETHRRRLMERLGVHDVAGLVRSALRLGVVPPDR
jgi:DNA-binding NarL/FixJ family response regulator